jgi:hypothetical protein
MEYVWEPYGATRGQLATNTFATHHQDALNTLPPQHWMAGSAREEQAHVHASVGAAGECPMTRESLKPSSSADTMRGE